MLTAADIRFVHLGLEIEHLRNSISVFGFRIAFYGIIIGIGMLAGIWIAQSDARRRGQDPDLYLDFALYGIIFSIIGARTYYVIFDWDNYKNDLIQIFQFKSGRTGHLWGSHSRCPDLACIYQSEETLLLFHGRYGSSWTDYRTDHRKVGELF